MTRLLSRLIYWLFSVYLLVMPLGALWLLLRLDQFQQLMAGFLISYGINWDYVSEGQLYALWVLTTVALGLWYCVVLFLQRCFRSFARGEWIDLENSRHLRAAATLLLIEAVAGPVLRTAESLLMTMNQPPGERMLVLGVGTVDLRSLISGLVLWVLADLLVKGMQAVQENREFV